MSDEPLRVTALRADIARRLRPVCAWMPEEQFNALVRRIAAIEFKYEQLDQARRKRLQSTDSFGSE